MRVPLVLSACVAGLLALSACSPGGGEPIAFPSSASAPVSASQPASPSPSVVPATTGPVKVTNANGVFKRTATGSTAVVGTAGSLKKYCVQVEEGIDFSPDDFAAVIDVVLANEKSWIAGKKWMFQRLPDCATVNLRIKLAVPRTVDRLC